MNFSHDFGCLCRAVMQSVRFDNGVLAPPVLASLDVLSLSKDGVLKVAPLYHWTVDELNRYLVENGLPSIDEYGESDYFDPTKALAHRECGLHTQI